jgi:hypothetical protein
MPKCESTACGRGRQRDRLRQVGAHQLVGAKLADQEEPGHREVKSGDLPMAFIFQ